MRELLKSATYTLPPTPIATLVGLLNCPFPEPKLPHCRMKGGWALAIVGAVTASASVIPTTARRVSDVFMGPPPSSSVGAAVVVLLRKMSGGALESGCRERATCEGE